MSSFSKIRSFVELTRPYNATTLLLAFSIGYFFLSNNRIGNHFLLGNILILLVHSVATIQNDIADFEIDKINVPLKPLQNNRITLNEARKLQYILAACAISLSLILLPIHFIFVVSMLLVSWVYNKQPFLLSRQPVSSLIILGLAYSLAPMLYGFILNGNTIEQPFILTLISWFVLRISISVMKDYRDKKGDKLFHKMTFYIIFGKNITTWLSVIFALFGYLGILLISVYIRKVNLFLLIPTALAIKNIFVRFKLLSINEDNKANKIFHKAFFGQNQFEAIYLIWLIFSPV